MRGLRHNWWVWAGVAVIAILGCGIAAISFSIKNQLKLREFSALQSMRIVVKAAANYHTKFGAYAPALQDLAVYEEGWTKSYATEPVFTGKYYGYRFEYEAPFSPAGRRDTFLLRAVPFAPGSKDAREFCADQSGTIRIARKGTTCTTSSDEIYKLDEYGRLKLP